jgi:hypothetical protein
MRKAQDYIFLIGNADRPRFKREDNIKTDFKNSAGACGLYSFD